MADIINTIIEDSTGRREFNSLEFRRPPFGEFNTIISQLLLVLDSHGNKIKEKVSFNDKENCISRNFDGLEQSIIFLNKSMAELPYFVQKL